MKLRIVLQNDEVVEFIRVKSFIASQQANDLILNFTAKTEHIEFDTIKAIEIGKDLG